MPVVRMIYGYMLVLPFIFFGVLWFLYDGAQGPLVPVEPDPTTLGLYALGLGAAALAFVLPQRLAAGRQPVASYVVRLGMIELCGVAGLVLAMLENAPMMALPLLAVCFVLTLMAAPTDRRFA
jgi:hypothetical protein